MSKNNYNFESFIEKHKNTKSSFGNKIIIEKSEVKKHFRGFLIDPGLKKIIKTEFEKILFGFKNSFVVFEDGVVPSLPGTNGKKYSFKEVRDFTVKKTGFITSGHWFDENSNKVSLIIGGEFKIGTELFEEFQKLLSDKKTSPVRKKPISKNDSDKKTSKDKSKVVKDNKRNKKSKTPKSPLDGITIIVKPKGKLSFGDLNGNTVPGIKTTLKQRCRDEGSYLGLKTTPKSSRWILLNKEYVTPFLSDSKFVSKYSNYVELIRKIPKIDNLIRIRLEKEKVEKEKREKELNRKKKLSSSIKKLLSELDKDGNGELDTVQIKDDFDKLVKKHQQKIIEINRNYVQQFVKISNYQKLKRKNLQKLFEEISRSKYQSHLNQTIKILKERIHSYELILFHSLCMVTCLVEDDMFTFYEIYESFDKLKIFKSDHEREVSEQLSNIEIGIYELISSIRSMEKNVVEELSYLSYVTESSFQDLSESVTEQLSSINSSIKFNNLLTGIQTYQTYKINQNTKSLRG